MAVVGIVPAAGYATRLQPLEGSKELLEVAGKPVMDHVLERMLAAGATELRIVTRPEKHDVIEHAATLGAAVVTGVSGHHLRVVRSRAHRPCSGGHRSARLARHDLGAVRRLRPPRQGGRGRCRPRSRALSHRRVRPDAIRCHPLRRRRRPRRDRDQARRAAVRLDLGLRRRSLHGSSSARDVRVAGRAFRRNGSRGQAREKRPPLRLLARHRHAGRARSARRPASLRQPAAPALVLPDRPVVRDMVFERVEPLGE